MAYLNYIWINNELCLMMNDKFNNTMSVLNNTLNDNDYREIFNLKEYTDVVSINESLLDKLHDLLIEEDYDRDYSGILTYFKVNNMLKYIKPITLNNNKKYVMSGFDIKYNKICHVEYKLTNGFFHELFFEKICPKCYSYDFCGDNMYNWKLFKFLDNEDEYQYYRRTSKAPDKCKICHNDMYNEYIYSIYSRLKM